MQLIMDAFFRRVANGEAPGFPRVQPRHNFFTLVYPAMYIKIEGNTVLLPTGGKGKKNKQFPIIYAKITEDAAKGYREVAINLDARGNYYASFVFSKKEEPQEQGKVVAFS